jgi:uncharacterized protein
MIVDTHHHIGLSASGFDFSDSWRRAEQEERTRWMEQYGITHCVVHPAHGFSRDAGHDAFRRVNDWAAEYCRDGSSFVLAGTGVIDPRNRELAVAEAERCVTELGLCGISFHHHFLGTYINDPAMNPILDCAAELGFPVFIHVIAGSALEDIWRLYDLATRYPHVRFVAMDGFSSPSQSSQIVARYNDFDNIWYDTAVMISVGNRLEGLLQRHGSTRIMFGSDRYSLGGSFRVPFGLLELNAMAISESERGDVLSGNIQSLVGKSRRPERPQAA